MSCVEAFLQPAAIFLNIASGLFHYGGYWLLSRRMVQGRGYEHGNSWSLALAMTLGPFVWWISFLQGNCWTYGYAHLAMLIVPIAATIVLWLAILWKVSYGAMAALPFLIFPSSVR